jgi:hypothetical protein
MTLLQEKISSFIKKSTFDQHDDREEEFNELMIEAACFQFLHNAVYHSYLVTHFPHYDPAHITHWSEIVPLPVDYYRRYYISTSSQMTFLNEESYCQWDFEGNCVSVSLSMQELVRLREAWYFLPQRDEYLYLLLHPDCQSWPHHKLSYLYTEYVNKFPYSDGIQNSGKDSFDVRILHEGVIEAQKALQPLCILTDDRSVDFIEDNILKTQGISLPVDSVLIRGIIPYYPAQNLTLFNIPSEKVVSIYSPSFVLSSFYTPTLALEASGVIGDIEWASTTFQGPPWTRVRAFSSGILEEDAPNGELILYDLASIGNCIAVRTDYPVIVTRDSKFFSWM